MNKEDAEILVHYFGNDYPRTAREAKLTFDNDSHQGERFPVSVYCALQRLLISDMGGKDTAKKRDRRKGKQRRAKKRHT